MMRSSLTRKAFPGESDANGSTISSSSKSGHLATFSWTESALTFFRGENSERHKSHSHIRLDGHFNFRQQFSNDMLIDRHHTINIMNFVIKSWIRLNYNFYCSVGRLQITKNLDRSPRTHYHSAASEKTRLTFRNHRCGRPTQNHVDEPVWCPFIIQWIPWIIPNENFQH